MASPNENYSYWIPRFSSKDRTYMGIPLGDSQNDNRGQIIRNRFLLTMGNETSNCGHHNSTCAKKCLQNFCPVAQRNAENVEVFTEECQYCHEKIIIPLEDHYVKRHIMFMSLQNTCKNILMRRKRETLKKKEQDKIKRWKRIKMFRRYLGQSLRKTLNKIKGWFGIRGKSEKPE